MEISIEQILQAIATMTAEELAQVMDAIGQRLEQLETPSFEARSIRQAIRSSRTRASRIPAKGIKNENDLITFLRADMREKHQAGRSR